MPAKPKRKMTRKVVSRRVRTATKAAAPAIRGGKARLNKAAKALERAAANYARLANRAGVAAKKAAKRVSRTKTGKALAAAALAVAGYVAVRAARKR